jgi:hypothetical protein
MTGSQESFGSSLRLSPEDLATPPRSVSLQKEKKKKEATF